ncbi:MAG: helical backbone metal receptor [Gammaproteobacteria bacterium]|nr:helical backbone metal receptor [Gammaproteobacteria bacterium]
MTRRALLLLLAAATAGAAPLQVTDDRGLHVQLPVAAQRIVTLAPHATELVVAAGAADALVAIAAGSPTNGALAALPRIGGPGPLDRERLLVLRPDLVIAWDSGNRAADLDWIARTGVPLFRSEPRDADDIADTLVAIGRLTGNTATATAAAAAFRRALRTPCADLPRQPVYVRVWDRPAMSLGGRHWLNTVLPLAGYRNVLAAQPRGAIRIAPEAQLALQALPSVSLVRRHDGSAADRLAELLSRPGPRLADAVQLLCRQRLRLAASPRR